MVASNLPNLIDETRFPILGFIRISCFKFRALGSSIINIKSFAYKLMTDTLQAKVGRKGVVYSFGFDV